MGNTHIKISRLLGEIQTVLLPRHWTFGVFQVLCDSGVGLGVGWSGGDLGKTQPKRLIQIFFFLACCAEAWEKCVCREEHSVSKVAKNKSKNPQMLLLISRVNLGWVISTSTLEKQGNMAFSAGQEEWVGSCTWNVQSSVWCKYFLLLFLDVVRQRPSGLISSYKLTWTTNATRFHLLKVSISQSVCSWNGRRWAQDLECGPGFLEHWLTWREMHSLPSSLKSQVSLGDWPVPNISLTRN